MPRKSPAEYYSELQEIVRDRGGKLLSRTYSGDLGKLRFRCAEGHEWEAAPGKIKQGRWCPTCGRSRTSASRKAATSARLRRLVERRGGEILSGTYVTNSTKLRYRCARGHEWEAVPQSILTGTWCPKCGREEREANRKQRVLRRLQRLATKRGGEILSPTFEGSRVPLLVRCAAGHEWRMKGPSIDQGVWCPECKQESWLDLVRAKAEERGGACRSKRCRGGADRVLLECARGHRWTSTATRVKRGSWCPTCNFPASYDIAQLRVLARERGGDCLSSVYVDSDTKLLWICSEGHEWEAKPATLIQGTWCRECERGYGRSRARLSIRVMREMARERGGRCLSKDYFGIYSRLRWRCAKGHEWETVANNVRRGGWCPKCAHSARGTLEGMRALAVARGGKCRSRSWNDHRRPLLFECGAGHRFSLRANVAKSGVWCPQCPRR